MLNEREQFIGREIIKEIANRLRFLALVGLDYLTSTAGQTPCREEKANGFAWPLDRDTPHRSHVCP